MSEEKEIRTLLEENGVGDLADTILDNGFRTIKVLKSLTREDMEEIGITRPGIKRTLQIAFGEGGHAYLIYGLPILQRTLFYHFEELPWAAEALHKLKERNKRLVVLHGPYATGKTSILKWATKALAKGFNVEVSFTDGSSLTPTAPELKPERFWKRLGRQILNNNTISSSSDMLDDLIQIYGNKRWYWIMDEMTSMLTNIVARHEFLEFMKLLCGPGEDVAFFKGFLGAGTLFTKMLLQTPPVAPLVATPDESLSHAQPPQRSLQTALENPLMDPNRCRSPFQNGQDAPVGTLSLEQTLKYLSAVEENGDIKIDDEAKADIHYFTNGNIGLLVSCAAVVFSTQVELVTMADWEKLKLSQVEENITNTNRMVQRIHSKFQKASNATKALLLHLLRTDGPIRPDYSDEEAASSLVDMGIAVKVDVVQLALAGSYVRMLLLRMAYPRRHVDPTIVVPRRKDGSIDGLSLLRLALQYVDRDVIYDPLSRNRTGSAEAVIQAELYAVLRGIGCVSAKFTTLVEVKHPQGEEMPLDLLLLDKDTSAAVVGYELKVQLLRKSEIVNAVRNQAVRYKNDHQISQMYLVNFFSTECTRDADIPGSIDDVTCVMIKYESGFENLHVEVPSGCSTPKA